MDDDYKVFLTPPSSPPIFVPPYDRSSYYSPPAPQIITMDASGGHGYCHGGTPIYPSPWSPPVSGNGVAPDYHGFYDGQLRPAAPGLFYAMPRMTGGATAISAAPSPETEPWQLTPQQSIKADRVLYGPRSRPMLPVFEAICPSETDKEY